ncbi:uncharacterized protein LOC128958292 [Oppia nitens]|uniref:uncharacterized protein LOC128958292 n=1 Tax=Oppia nitens TaxID=1686743 RepID=UPI0023DC8CFD|nr:uncharacterized protein LOC128958292 [Oppia nitens]
MTTTTTTTTTPPGVNNKPFLELDDLNDCLHEFWLKNDLLLTRCRQLLARAISHKSNTNIAKSFGTGIGGAGALAMAAGVGLAPFTAGVSTIVTLGGAVSTAVGAMTVYGTDANDYWFNREVHAELRELATDRNVSADRLFDELSHYDVDLNRYDSLEDKSRPVGDDDDSLVKFLQYVANGSLTACKVGDNTVKLVDAIKEYRTLKTTKELAQSVDVVHKAGYSVGQLLTIKAHGLSAIAAATRTAAPTIGMLALKSASAASGLLFTFIDVVTLMKDWDKQPPTVDEINSLVDDLNRDSALIITISAMMASALDNSPCIQLPISIKPVIIDNSDNNVVSDDDSWVVIQDNDLI